MSARHDFTGHLCDLLAEATDALALRDGLAALLAPSPLVAERGVHPFWEPIGAGPTLPEDASVLALGRWGRLVSTPAVISALSPFATALAKAFDRCDRTVPAGADGLESSRRRGPGRPPLSAGQDAILIADVSGRCQIANRAFFDLFDLTGDTPPATLKDFARHFTKSHSFLAWVNAAARTPGVTDSLELPLKETPDRRIEITSSLLTDGLGSEFARLLVFRDAGRDTAVDQVKAEFINIVSHELRTPLTSVLGFAELVLTRDLTTEKLRQYVGTIYEEGKRLAALLDDFLDINRLESRRQPYAMQELQIRPLLEKSASLFASSEPHTLEVEAPATLPVIVGDAERLMQCLNNLVSNAVKYSPDGGRVTLKASVAQNGAGLLVQVSDEGLGIPDVALGSLFRKFYRVHRPEWQGIGGTGLGLAICREIVRAHGGDIWCESKDGSGSTFSFTLPAALPRPKSPRKGAKPAATES